MSSNANDCYSTDSGLLTYQQAQSHILALARPVSEFDTREINSAFGGVLAATITSPINVPPYANSAMDGYAVRASDLFAEAETNLKIAGTALAGKPYPGSLSAGQCIRIMTGAKMPEGADTVIMQEQVQRQDDTITVVGDYQAGENIRYPGEDIAAGSEVLAAGQWIGPAELGLLASLGIAQVQIYRRLRVAFFSTGDELRPVGSQLEEGQIYDSNRYTLHGMLSQLGVDLLDMGVIEDDPAAIETALAQAAQQADVVITTGGVSVGEADYIKATLDKLGKVEFWRIAMKPGKPLAFGSIGQALFFGLPGNPVSVMATFYLFVMPALRRMMGQNQISPLKVSAICKQPLKKRPGRADFQRGVLSYEDGRILVDTAGIQASHILSGMSRANCFIALPLGAGNIEAGSEVEVLPFHGLMG